MNNTHNIAIFASGGGSNAEAIIQYFKDKPYANIALIVSNNANAGILEKAQNHQIKTFVHSKEQEQDETLLDLMRENDIDFIVLAGYMRKVNPNLVKNFERRMVNIHPALLPKFGGKGMYGMNVHKAVVAAGETESGPTIHFVNEYYDEGAIIQQQSVSIDPKDTAEEVQKKVLKLEHEYYPQVIDRLIQAL